MSCQVHFWISIESNHLICSHLSLKEIESTGYYSRVGWNMFFCANNLVHRLMGAVALVRERKKHDSTYFSIFWSIKSCALFCSLFYKFCIQTWQIITFKSADDSKNTKLLLLLILLIPKYDFNFLAFFNFTESFFGTTLCEK